MSNIIDGHDIGMGYETVKERCGGIQALHGGRWINLAPIPGIGLNPEGHYRRPLPIISQHPGAIPLEPGEELVDDTDCLTRSGATVTFAARYGHWDVHGRSESSRQYDIIARLPKVEKKEPEKTICDLTAMAGKMGVRNIEQYLPEPKKAKEEKVEEFPRFHIATFGPVHDKWINLSEAARIAQLPEVQAEVERQRKEKEIKVGDWFWTKSGTPDRAHAIGIEKPEVLGQSDKWHKAQDCTKIHDPAFLALLERGVGNG